MPLQGPAALVAPSASSVYSSADKVGHTPYIQQRTEKINQQSTTQTAHNADSARKMNSIRSGTDAHRLSSSADRVSLRDDSGWAVVS
jgi:hypothetical protein